MSVDEIMNGRQMASATGMPVLPDCSRVGIYVFEKAQDFCRAHNTSLQMVILARKQGYALLEVSFHASHACTCAVVAYTSESRGIIPEKRPVIQPDMMRARPTWLSRHGGLGERKDQ